MKIVRYVYGQNEDIKLAAYVRVLTSKSEKEFFRCTRRSHINTGAEGGISGFLTQLDIFHKGRQCDFD